ncbi:MAG: DUF2085 domain-containing protein [Chloroflexi bacterium]|nr:DUF2085 domain-containing protein [Chloroflexota bacterium]
MDADSPRQARLDACTRRLTRWLGRFLHSVSRHWLALVNLIMGLQAALPFLAPVLMHAGRERGARLIYLFFRPQCHQLPERSFFLFGDQWTYSLAELQARTGLDPVPLRFLGQLGLGWKTAICERDVAIYAAMFLGGLLYALLRTRIRPLPFKAFLALIAPMALDGGGQLLQLWSSTWLTRVLTGGLFGLACIWLVYPHLNRGMAEVQRSTAPTALEVAP